MLRVRYLFYLGLFCYLLDLHQIGSDALSLLPKKKDKSESAESDKNAKENVGKAKERNRKSTKCLCTINQGRLSQENTYSIRSTPTVAG
ncbi:uncharacterized protein LOC131669307 isoform X2 [Phymastichus coffea]|uniref:uncharacterized protein LOC131669307 isoform X2 n=1 Tax=Phymastichus coffea TaxID=108790 RepID=UPI00273B97CF|nr:uncharacterized protein LOC131669307 isoform X2 [Phymastichus coffea]